MVEFLFSIFNDLTFQCSDQQRKIIMAVCSYSSHGWVRLLWMEHHPLAAIAPITAGMSLAGAQLPVELIADDICWYYPYSYYWDRHVSQLVEVRALDH